MRVCRHCERVTLVIHLHFHSESATDYLQHWISIHLSLRYNLRDKLPTPNSFVSITLLPLFYHTDTCHRYIYIYILLEGGEGSRNWTNFALDRFSSTFERYKSRLKLTRTNFSFKKDLQYVQIIFARVTCHMSHVARGCPPKVDSSSFSSPLIGSIVVTITNVDYFYIPTESYWKFCSIALQRSMYPSSFTSSTMFFILSKRTREENAQESESHSTRSPAHAEVSHRWWWWWCRGEAWGSFRKDVRNGIPLAAIRSSQPRINGGSE